MSTLAPPLPVQVPVTAPCAAQKIVINGEVTLPVMTTLDEFIEWSMSDARPVRGRFAFLAGTIWVDLMSEQLFTHNRLKNAFAIVLGQLEIELGTGAYFADGADLDNRTASFSTIPDGMYVLYETFRLGRVVRKPNRHKVGVVRLEGIPDMVLEVVSDSSQDKDYVQIEASYYLAGVPEFWRVDARGELRFEILRRDAAGYVPTRQPDGWWRSEIFGQDFLLTAGVDPIGEPRFTLQHRP